MLTVCLIGALLPTFALRVYATPLDPAAELTVNGNTTQYESFEKALQAASGDATITLLKDASYKPFDAPSVGTAYRLHSLTLTSRGNVTLMSSTDAAGFLVIYSGGVVNFDGADLTIIGAKQTFTLEGGTFNMKNGKLQGLNTAIGIISIHSGNMNMTGGTLESKRGVIGCANVSSGTLHLSGGKLIADDNPDVWPVVNFTSGTFSVYLSGGDNLSFQNGAGLIGGIEVHSGVTVYGKDGDSSFTGAVKVINNAIRFGGTSLELGDTIVWDASKDANYSYASNCMPYGRYTIERNGDDFVVCKKSQAAPDCLIAEKKCITMTAPSMEYASSETATTWNPCTDRITITGIGTWYVRYKETDTLKAGVPTKVIVAPQLAEDIQLNQKNLFLTKGQKATLQATVTPTDTTNPALNWTSSNNSVATVDASGNVTANKNGTAVITATTTDGSGISAQCSVTVGYVVTYKCNGGTNIDQNPVVVTGTSKVKLKNPTRSGYIFAGWYTDKKLTKGIGSIAKGTTSSVTLYAKWDKVKVDKPSVRDLKNVKTKKMNLKIDKVNGAKGYEVVYSTNKKFAKNATTITTSKTNPTISKLEKGKKYYVKVRAYKIDSTGNKVYGKYSGVMSVKIIK